MALVETPGLDHDNRTMATTPSPSKWRLHGVRVVRAGELDTNTPQTPGMNRAAAITTATAGAEKLWAGTVVIHPKAKTGAHHHGPVESVIYVVSGRARMRWGAQLEFVAEAGGIGQFDGSTRSGFDGRHDDVLLPVTFAD